MRRPAAAPPCALGKGSWGDGTRWRPGTLVLGGRSRVELQPRAQHSLKRRPGAQASALHWLRLGFQNKLRGSWCVGAGVCQYNTFHQRLEHTADRILHILRCTLPIIHTPTWDTPFKVPPLQIINRWFCSLRNIRFSYFWSQKLRPVIQSYKKLWGGHTNVGTAKGQPTHTTPLGARGKAKNNMAIQGGLQILCGADIRLACVQAISTGGHRQRRRAALVCTGPARTCDQGEGHRRGGTDAASGPASATAP